MVNRTAVAGQIDNPAPIRLSYGATGPVGEARERCDTPTTRPGAVVLSPNDDWQRRIQRAVAGETLLLRGGLYEATAQVRIPAGHAGQPITLKPYNCEAVTLYASLRPRSYNIIAGLRIETVGLSDAKWAIRVDGKNLGHIEQVIIRNNTILGGEIDAIRILDDATHVFIMGNHIDGGGNGHNIFVTAEERALLPDQIEITNNWLTKHYYATIAEDMFQVRDVKNVFFSQNTCTDGLNMEQCVDIKSTQAPIVVSYNLFDGEYLHQSGAGEDGAGGCMVIHESDGAPDNHIILGNFFKQCKGTAIRFAAGAPGEVSRATVSRNLFVQSNTTDGTVAIWQARNVEWTHNTMVNGYLKLGDEAQTRMPRDTVIKNNIFSGTRIEDRTRPPEAIYRCSHNLLYQTSGAGFTQSPCTHHLDDNPLFVNPAVNDFRLQGTTPARARGDDSLTLGAYPFDFLSFAHRLYLPLIAEQ